MIHNFIWATLDTTNMFMYYLHRWCLCQISQNTVALKITNLDTKTTEQLFINKDFSP